MRSRADPASCHHLIAGEAKTAQWLTHTLRTFGGGTPQLLTAGGRGQGTTGKWSMGQAPKSFPPKLLCGGQPKNINKSGLEGVAWHLETGLFPRALVHLQRGGAFQRAGQWEPSRDTPPSSIASILSKRFLPLPCPTQQHPSSSPTTRWVIWEVAHPPLLNF